MMCTYVETFDISAIAPNVTLVVYGTVFGGMNPLAARVSGGQMCNQSEIDYHQ